MTTRAEWLLIAGLAALVGLGFQGSRGLFETTEGRYAEIARDMLERGEFLEPTLAGRPHWTKPPPAYWAVAGGLRLAGRNAWGARLPNAVAFVATALLVAAIGASLWDGRTGRVAGLVYGTSLLPAIGASVVSADMLLTVVETTAMLAFVRARATAHANRARWWIRLMWLAFGLAFFVKGPPGLLPLAALIAFTRLDRARSPRLADGWGLLAFAVVGGWWYLLSALRHPGLMSYFIGNEVVGRVLTAQHDRNPEWYKPAVIYGPVLLLAPGVWLALAGPVAARLALPGPVTAWRRIRRGGAPAFLALWVLLPLLVFSLARSRLPLYVLPLYAPVALALSRGITARHPHPPHRMPGIVRVLATAAAVGLVLLKAVAARIPSASDMSALAHAIAPHAGRHALVWLVNEDQLFGLDFYRGGRVRRVSWNGTEPWADRSLVALLRPVEEGRISRRVLVARSAERDSLLKSLAGRPLVWRVIPLPYRALIVVEPARPDPLGHMGPPSRRRKPGPTARWLQRSSGMPLTARQRQHLEQRLREERTRLLRTLQRSVADDEASDQQDQSADLSKLPYHLADLGTDTMEAELEASNLTRMSSELADIDAALERLYRTPERFGICEDTGAEIPYERLDVIPWARTCEQANG